MTDKKKRYNHIIDNILNYKTEDHIKKFQKILQEKYPDINITVRTESHWNEVTNLVIEASLNLYTRASLGTHMLAQIGSPLEVACDFAKAMDQMLEQKVLLWAMERIRKRKVEVNYMGFPIILCTELKEDECIILMHPSQWAKNTARNFRME